MAKIDASKYDLKEKVVHINRVAKVVKGGRRFSFAVLVVVGNGQGVVGTGTGKASEVPDAVKKAVEDAKKNLIEVPMKGTTLYHETMGLYKASRVMLKPASPGTGIIAGGGVRAVCELAGLHDVLTKSIRSDNNTNVVKATIEGLKAMRSPERIAALRGRSVEDLMGAPKP